MENSSAEDEKKWYKEFTRTLIGIQQVLSKYFRKDEEKKGGGKTVEVQGQKGEKEDGKCKRK